MDESLEFIDYIRRLNRLLKRYPARRKLHHGGVRILRLLSRRERLRTGELAALLDIRPSSATDSVTRLEGMGLVRREKDEADSRMVWVSITEEGVEELARSEVFFRGVNDRVKAMLSPEEQELFCGVCEKLIEELEREVPDEKEPEEL